MTGWRNLNFMERFIILGLGGSLVALGYLSYTGFGLPTQANAEYIRQAAANNVRAVRGGGLSGGK